MASCPIAIPHRLPFGYISAMQTIKRLGYRKVNTIIYCLCCCAAATTCTKSMSGTGAVLASREADGFLPRPDDAAPVCAHEPIGRSRRRPIDGLRFRNSRHHDHSSGTRQQSQPRAAGGGERPQGAELPSTALRLAAYLHGARTSDYISAIHSINSSGCRKVDTTGYIVQAGRA